MTKFSISNLVSEKNLDKINVLEQNKIFGGSLIIPPTKNHPGGRTIPLDFEPEIVDSIYKYDRSS